MLLQKASAIHPSAPTKLQQQNALRKATIAASEAYCSDSTVDDDPGSFPIDRPGWSISSLSVSGSPCYLAALELPLHPLYTLSSPHHHADQHHDQTAP